MISLSEVLRPFTVLQKLFWVIKLREKLKETLSIMCNTDSADLYSLNYSPDNFVYNRDILLIRSKFTRGQGRGCLVFIHDYVTH